MTSPHPNAPNLVLPIPLVLASVSPRRRELLQSLGLPFETVPSAADELDHDHLTAPELCQVNAYRKARTVAKRYPDALILGADTLVYLGPRRFGKPASRQEAETMLSALQGRQHAVATGVCLLHLRKHRCRTFADITDVQFRQLTLAAIRHYLDQINPLDKAGGYALQEHGHLIIRRILGSRTNVIGLPLERLELELKAFLQPDAG